jgi:hypothetical protein
MTSDLVVNAIIPPTKVTAPCPTKITVEILNNGPDPAVGIFEVCLDVFFFSVEEKAVQHYSEWVKEHEGQRLSKGQMVSVVFEVQLPCASQVTIMATADCSHSITNNINNLSTPPISQTKQIVVSKIHLLPWLWTDLRVGIEDSSGVITYDPPVLCSGATLVIEAIVNNQGCITAPASVTEIKLTDTNTGLDVGTVKSATPSIPVGMSVIGAKFMDPVPILAGSGPLKISACADLTSVVSQCDRSHVCSTPVTKQAVTLVAPPSPPWDFKVDGPIFPGQQPSITWTILSSCLDLASIIVAASYTGIEVYKSPTTYVALQSGAEEKNIIIPTIPASIANSFFTIGNKQLNVQLKATGNNPGPYIKNVPMSVLPDMIDSTWWTWTGPRPGASPLFWKTSSYGFAGTLTNLGTAKKTPTSVVLVEHDVAAPSSARDISRTTLINPIALATNASATFTWTGISQTWQWLDSVMFMKIGPLSRTFSYTVEFMWQDEFNNVYPKIISSPVLVTVSVAATKIAGADLAAYFLWLSIDSLVLAGIFLAAGALPAAGGALAAAASFLTLSRGFGAGALDPPIPDFHYHEQVKVSLSLTLAQLIAKITPEYITLRSIVELAGRISAAWNSLGKIHSKLLGAYVDGSNEGINIQLESYKETEGLLSRSADALVDMIPQAMDEMEQIFTSQNLKETIKNWKQGLPDNIRKELGDQGVSKDDILFLENALERLSIEEFDTPRNYLYKISSALSNLAKSVREESQVILSKFSDEFHSKK